VHPDRDARRTWRLVHLVRRIEWRVTATAEEAIARERELLLTHRPRFNRASVWPSPNWFIELTADKRSLSLQILRESVATIEEGDPQDKTTCPQNTQITQIRTSPADENPFPFLRDSVCSAGKIFSSPTVDSPHRFGPFNSGLRHLFPTLLRLLFLLLAKPNHFSEIPLKLLKNRALDHYRFSLSSGDESLIGKISHYLNLESDDLIRHLETEILAASPVMSAFEKTYRAAELEILQNFFDARVSTDEKPRME
jgi:hypothetical protein